MPFMMFLECTEEIMIQRIQKRARESSSGTLRNDDNSEVLVRRFETFKNETLPVVEQFEKNGKLKRIDANKSADEVTRDVVQMLRESKLIM